MKKKIKYTDEPSDGLELPESGYEVLAGSVVSKKWRELSISGESYDKLRTGEKLQLIPKRGGIRKGAGRKSSGNVRLQLSISPATRQKIESFAKSQKINLSQAVEQLAASV